MPQKDDNLLGMNLKMLEEKIAGLEIEVTEHRVEVKQCPQFAKVN